MSAKGRERDYALMLLDVGSWPLRDTGKPLQSALDLSAQAYDNQVSVKYGEAMAVPINVQSSRTNVTSL